MSTQKPTRIRGLSLTVRPEGQPIPNILVTQTEHMNLEARIALDVLLRMCEILDPLSVQSAVTHAFATAATFMQLARASGLTLETPTVDEVVEAFIQVGAQGPTFDQGRSQ